ncbi:DUF488 domain-containing protein [Clostridium chauvoei]|uniref:DUF488 domain-containing protein n=2 Tax=Clostridium chauvoei TaxID=46867 RepID=S6ESL2_9CLOT|nr:DUF488 domain-containing protein [Clostridium chauvoei]ATD55503.1 hypothetical protein BTM20_09770 [Clostridium chauvoei]ATD56821.1 hypothetical protein BTM21_03255 [Clostridium chauvoei]MBX7280720.1 DUF488 domain-containing protein [Clostridium chauvoei]MBX7283203.1 DUF488 domain-containing protein [Clostridium chauvoei]MBX7285761.1 DUF488 domain-containing protein [Clostridium chauvoei]
MDIFTIGHSNYTLEKLIDMLRYHNINCVVDIRGTPYSKYNIQFDKEKLRYSLRKEGFIYIYMGKELAAKRDNKESYNNEGYADFEKVVLETEFLKAVERLKIGCNKGYKIALLGAMQDPIRCHRSILVGKALKNLGFNVKHIIDDYSIIFQEGIEENILDKYFKGREQLTIDILLGNEMSRKEMIEEGYRLANKEIGYRIEHIIK